MAALHDLLKNRREMTAMIKEMNQNVQRGGSTPISRLIAAIPPHVGARRRARFYRIFRRRTGFATLDRLLDRLYANKDKLLRVGPVPLHTNGSECDLWPHVIKRKISGGTRSDQSRACRDAFLGLLLTCAKLGVSFWDFLGQRLGIAQADAPYLPELIRLRSATA